MGKDLIMKKGHIGQAVADLQARLRTAGFDAPATAVYDDTTVAAVRALQRAYRLVDDGVFGPKSDAALRRQDLGKLLRESDLTAAADRLAVPLASIKAVNSVESQGLGFLADGRPKILYERHVFYERLTVHGIDPVPLAARMPYIVNSQRGGYAGGAAEYIRLAAAIQVCRPAALEACSWGAFQIMGHHWQRLGYDDLDAFVQAMSVSEAKQLDAFVRFVVADVTLLKALRGRKWAQFARLYNGPAYAENLYDVKLARAYAAFSAPTPAEAP